MKNEENIFGIIAILGTLSIFVLIILIVSGVKQDVTDTPEVMKQKSYYMCVRVKTINNQNIKDCDNIK